VGKTLIENVLTAAAIAAVIFLFVTNKKPKKMDTTQELFDYTNISNDGLVQLPGQRYRKVIEVYPVNMATKSVREQAGIWDAFRTMINSLTVPVTFLVQSTHLNNTDYIVKVRNILQETENPALKVYGESYIKHVYNLSENRSLQSKKYYIITKIDVSADTVDSGVNIDDNTVAIAVNAILKSTDKPAKLSDEEAERLARSELDNITTVIGSYLSQMGIRFKVLDKKGVVDMAYTTYNRDLASIVSTKEVDAIEAFSLFTRSKTPDLYEAIERQTREEAANV
jgi:hypothetical protein